MSSHIAEDAQQFRLVFPGNILPGSDIELNKRMAQTPPKKTNTISISNGIIDKINGWVYDARPPKKRGEGKFCSVIPL